MTRNLLIPHDYPNPTISKFCHTPQLQNIAIPAMALSLRNFKNLLTLHMECFFQIGNPTYFFFLLRKVETMCQWFISLLVLLNVLLISIIILLSYKMLFSLDILCLWTMVSIGRLLQVPLPLLQVCCFIINNLPTLFCSDQFIAKDNAFSK